MGPLEMMRITPRRVYRVSACRVLVFGGIWVVRRRAEWRSFETVKTWCCDQSCCEHSCDEETSSAKQNRCFFFLSSSSSFKAPRPFGDLPDSRSSFASGEQRSSTPPQRKLYRAVRSFFRAGGDRAPAANERSGEGSSKQRVW